MTTFPDDPEGRPSKPNLVKGHQEKIAPTRLMEAPMETPVESHVESHVETHAETHVETHVETHMETYAETQAETHAETLTETPPEAAVIVATEAGKKGKKKRTVFLLSHCYGGGN